jgi:hypothetical protein
MSELTKVIANATQDALAGAGHEAETESGFTNADLPLYYRTDVINAIQRTAAQVMPDHVTRWVKVGQTTAANPAGKRLKGWRPIEDKIVIEKITSILGDGAKELQANGHIVYNELELWHMTKRQAAAIRHFNSLRAHGAPGDVTKSLENQFAEASDRTGGRVSVEMTPSDVFDRHAGVSVARKGSK